MQKYFLTDGKGNYIKKIGCKYKTTSSSFGAKEFTISEAQKCIDNNLPKSYKNKFYMEGVDDFDVIKPESINNERVGDGERGAFRFDSGVLELIEKFVNEFLEVKIPNKTKLLAYKKDLENAWQQYDLMLTDIDHWIMDNTPPAHVRTKIYGMQHKYENERKEVKEKLRFVVCLIDSFDKINTIEDIQKLLINERNKPYKPRTNVYKKLNQMVVR